MGIEETEKRNFQNVVTDFIHNCRDTVSDEKKFSLVLKITNPDTPFRREKVLHKQQEITDAGLLFVTDNKRHRASAAISTCGGVIKVTTPRNSQVTDNSFQAKKRAMNLYLSLKRWKYAFPHMEIKRKIPTDGQRQHLSEDNFITSVQQHPLADNSSVNVNTYDNAVTSSITFNRSEEVADFNIFPKPLSSAAENIISNQVSREVAKAPEVAKSAMRKIKMFHNLDTYKKGVEIFNIIAWYRFEEYLSISSPLLT